MRTMSVLCLLLSAGSALAATSGSDALLQAANAERARRATLQKRAPVLGEAELKARGGDVPLSTMGGPARPVAMPEVWTAPVARTADGVVKDERYWRDRMAKAEQRIVDLARDVEWTKRKISLMRMDLVVPGDPLREYNRKAELDGLFQEQARLEAELKAASLEPDRKPEEALHYGALPAWFS